MQNQNEITISGTFVTEQVTATFTKQILKIPTKNREGQQVEGDLDIYIKPELIQQWGIQDGAKVKLKGWIAFNFAPNGRSFPKVLATEIKEVEAAGQPAAQPQPQAQPQVQQPQMQAVQQPAMSAPQAPGVQPPAMGAPAQPQAPVAPSIPTPPPVA